MANNEKQVAAPAVKVDPLPTKGPTEAAVVVHSPTIDLDYWKGVYGKQGMTFKDKGDHTTFYPPEKVAK